MYIHTYIYIYRQLFRYICIYNIQQNIFWVHKALKPNRRNSINLRRLLPTIVISSYCLVYKFMKRTKAYLIAPPSTTHRYSKLGNALKCDIRSKVFRYK